MNKLAFALAPMLMRGAVSKAAKSVFKNTAKGVGASLGSAAVGKVKGAMTAPGPTQSPGASAPSNPNS